MTNETLEGISKALTDWRLNLPPRLRRQDVTMLARLLYLGSREGGVRQSVAERDLGINQPRMSKPREQPKLSNPTSPTASTVTRAGSFF